MSNVYIPTTRLDTIDFIKFEVVSNYYYYLLKNKFFVIKYSIGSAVRQRCKKRQKEDILENTITIYYYLFF